MNLSESNINYASFDTAIGRCVIAWKDSGITHVQLPEKNRSATIARVSDSSKAAKADPPGWILDVIEKLKKHLAGTPQDFSQVKLDLNDIADFYKRVYKELRTVQPGELVTYGELAKRVGSPRASRAVGQAMARNPLPILIPCHRVIQSSGELGGFSAYAGVKIKSMLLTSEKAKLAMT